MQVFLRSPQWAPPCVSGRNWTARPPQARRGQRGQRPARAELWGGARRCPARSRLVLSAGPSGDREGDIVSALLILQRQKDGAPGVLEPAGELRGGTWDRGGRTCPAGRPEQCSPHRAVSSSRCVPGAKTCRAPFPVRGQPRSALQGPPSGQGRAHGWWGHVSSRISRPPPRGAGGGAAGPLPTCRAHLGPWSLRPGSRRHLQSASLARDQPVRIRLLTRGGGLRRCVLGNTSLVALTGSSRSPF